MGADLLMAFMPVPLGADLDQMEQEKMSKIDNMDSSTLRARASELYNDLYGEDVDDKTDAELRTEINEFIKAAFHCVKHMPRDMGYIDRPTERLYFSGGESWGDDPTNAYTDLMNYDLVDMYMLMEPQ